MRIPPPLTRTFNCRAAPTTVEVTSASVSVALPSGLVGTTTRPKLLNVTLVAPAGDVATRAVEDPSELERV